MQSTDYTLPTKVGHIIDPSIISSKTPTGTVTSKPLNCIKHNHAGSYFMCAGNDRVINLFNANSGAHITTYTAHGYELTDLCISPDNARFASVGGDKSVFYWDVARGVTVRRFAGHYAKLNAVEMEQQQNGSVIASASFDATVRLWDTKSNSTVPIQILDEAKDSVSCLYVGQTEIVTGSVDGKVRTYDLRKGLLTTDVIGQPVTSVRQTSDEQALLVASLDSTVRLLDKANGGLLMNYEGHENTKYRIPAVFGHSELYVACGSEDGRIFMWDLEKGRKVGEVQGHHDRVVSGVSISQKTGQMITCGGDGKIVMWT